MTTITSRACDYGFPDVSSMSTSVDMDEKGWNMFMGPVTLYNLTFRFSMTGGTEYECYLKIYDDVSPQEGVTPATAVLKEPLLILQCRDGVSYTLNWPDGFSFTKGFSARATRTAGTGLIATDQDPQGHLYVATVGRKV